VLTTSIRREEFLLGTALAAFVPSVAICYLVYALFLACVELFAHPAVMSALLRGPEILAQVLFTPVRRLADLGRHRDFREIERCQGRVATRRANGLPLVAVSSLIAFDVIHATLSLALGLAAGLLILDGLGSRIISVTFDRERLITSSG